MLAREAFEGYKYAILRHTPRTQKWYMQILNVFVEWCEQEKITPGEFRQSHITRFIEEVRLRTNPKSGNPISSHTVNGYARVIKTFLFWCTKEDNIEHLVSERLPRRMEMPKMQAKVIETFSCIATSHAIAKLAQQRDMSS